MPATNFPEYVSNLAVESLYIEQEFYHRGAETQRKIKILKTLRLCVSVVQSLFGRRWLVQVRDIQDEILRGA